ncbi:MAG: 1-phosphofructokinase family hexose kinase [Candidatus Accumulibacter sp.]|jgi:1-phosphofructokinase|nr:1-phosphofructokinase family hexose kinase [Accumulibacter sp.]
MKIVTFTPNPAIDLTIRLEKLTPGEVQRAETHFTRAGGKGVNVSTALAGYGMDNTASGFLGAGNAGIFERHFSDLSIDDAFVRVDGENRTNIKIVDAAGTTDVNLNGFSVAEQDGEKFLARTDLLFSRENGIAVLSGSLPPGCPPDFHRTLVRRLKSRGHTVFLDADGAALASALSGDAVLPDGIKPNLRELSEWAGAPLERDADILAAAQLLLARGLRLVAVSLGGEGALFVDRQEALRVRGEPERIASTVGAGDAMMAGIAAAWAAMYSLEHTARLATAFALGWLKNSAAEKPFPWNGFRGKVGFREKVETALGKIRVEKVWAASETCHPDGHGACRPPGG